MKLSWMFGSSLGAHHLLWAYIAVWVIQGGYACWIGWQWIQSNKGRRLSAPAETRDDS